MAKIIAVGRSCLALAAIRRLIKTAPNQEQITRRLLVLYVLYEISYMWVDGWDWKSWGGVMY